MQIFVVNSKGGSGKTTIATQLASYYAHQKQQVKLIDWFQNRPQSLPEIQLVKDLNFIPIDSTTADITVHDMPAGFVPTGDCPLFAPAEVHKILIPILSSPTDIKAGLRLIMSIYKSGLLEKRIKAGFVANRTRSNLRYHQTLMDFLNRVDIPLIATLRDSQHYIRSMEHSISIFDLPPATMKQDLEQWQPIIDWLNEI
jgi:chromosome partitioning protein